ncbi:MAG: hypothetical protein M3Q15_00845 [Pseudomonadota bacterium]|nr:hypothetical protein [Pseudomonadota bacterium]
MGKCTRDWLYVAVALLVASPIAAPQLLAFPYHAQVGRHAVYGEAPISAQIIEQADELAAGSAIAERERDQPIFLTQGGWRWRWLGIGQWSAFAVSRPVVETIVVNRSHATVDKVVNGRSIAGSRSLSGTLAHEMTHGAIREHFGALADVRYPAWLREGYCDYVAGGGSLSDADARALIAGNRDVPALAYWRGRKRVEAALAANRGSVDALFASVGE